MLIEEDELEARNAPRSANAMAHVLLARDVMKKPITINLDEDLADAASIMIKHGISGLPVVDDGMLKGIVTKTDIIRALADHA